MPPKYRSGGPTELLRPYERDPFIKIERRRIDFYTNKNEEEYFNVKETYTIQNTSEAPINEFYLNVEQFRVNLIVTDSDGTELPYIPRESLPKVARRENIRSHRDLTDFGVLYIELPINKQIKPGETSVIYLAYIYPYEKWNIEHEVNFLYKVALSLAEWTRGLFFNTDITQFTFDVSSVNHTYFSVLGTDHATVLPLVIINAEDGASRTIYFNNEADAETMGTYVGKGYFSFHLGQKSKEQLELRDRMVLVFVSKAEAGRKRLTKSFTLIITLNALIVYVYEYRYFFEKLGQESSMFLLMLSLLISVFTLSLLPIHSRPIKFRNVILYASALIIGSFIISAYYMVVTYLIPFLVGLGL